MKTIGVIGLGSIGMRHASSLIALGHDVFGYDTNRDLMHKFSYFHDNPEHIFKMNCDGYVIASPTAMHTRHLGLCAHRPCFVEKPIAKNLDFFTYHPLMVGYNLRFHSAVITAKRWVAEGRIGEPLWANFCVAQYNNRPDYRRDGVILNWSHEIDLALYLLGPGRLKSSNTQLREYGQDVMTDILLDQGQCQTTIHMDYLTQPERRGFTITGTKDYIKCDLLRRLLGQGESPPFLMAGSYDQDYIDEMKAFIDRIDGKETPGCTAQEGLDVLKICLEVRKQAGL